MKSIKLIPIVLALLFILSFTVPVVVAQNMTYNVNYDLDGLIDMAQQIGHLSNTGAERKTTITGEGQITKVLESAQVAGKLTVRDAQDWVTAEGALSNLTVTTSIELCSPPKSSFTTTKHTPVGPGD